MMMRDAAPNRPSRRALRIGLLIVTTAMLAACSGGSLMNVGIPNWFARSNAPAATAQAQNSGGVRKLDEDCPSVDIRTGAGTLAIAARNDAPTANDLRYQLTFTELARECFVEAGTVRMRVGVQGRAIIGPAGAPPQVGVPIRYAVVQEGVQPKTITTKFRRSALALPPGSGSVTFTDIEEDLSFPLPPPAALVAYVVYVGFDEQGDRAQPQPKRKSPKRK
jgi:hypothetical protein